MYLTYGIAACRETLENVRMNNPEQRDTDIMMQVTHAVKYTIALLTLTGWV